MRMSTSYKLNPSLHIIITTGLCAALLAGCGIRGGLKSPPPLFGGTDDPTREAPTVDTDTNEYGFERDFEQDLDNLDAPADSAAETPEG